MKIRFVRLLSVLIFVLSASLAGCGDSVDSDSKTQSGGHAAVDFKCESETCNSSRQYCLVSKNESNGAIWTQECVALPSGCTGCDCAMADAPKQFPTANNCKTSIGCTSHNGQVAVTCYVPRW